MVSGKLHSEGCGSSAGEGWVLAKVRIDAESGEPQFGEESGRRDDVPKQHSSCGSRGTVLPTFSFTHELSSNTLLFLNFLKSTATTATKIYYRASTLIQPVRGKVAWHLVENRAANRCQSVPRNGTHPRRLRSVQPTERTRLTLADDETHLSLRSNGP